MTTWCELGLYHPLGSYHTGSDYPIWIQPILASRFKEGRSNSESIYEQILIYVSDLSTQRINKLQQFFNKTI